MANGSWLVTNIANLKYQSVSGDKYELGQVQISLQEMVHSESLLVGFSFLLALAERWRSFTSSSSFVTSSSCAESVSCRWQRRVSDQTWQSVPTCSFPCWIEPSSSTSPSALVFPSISTSISFPSTCIMSVTEPESKAHKCTCPSRWVAKKVKEEEEDRVKVRLELEPLDG